MVFKDDNGNPMLLDVNVFEALHGLMKDTRDDAVRDALKALISKRDLCSDVAARLTKIMAR